MDKLYRFSRSAGLHMAMINLPIACVVGGFALTGQWIFAILAASVLMGINGLVTFFTKLFDQVMEIQAKTRENQAELAEQLIRLASVHQQDDGK